MTSADRLLAELVAIVAEQSDDDGLWFMPQTATEAYLQEALMRIHFALESRTGEGLKD